MDMAQPEPIRPTDPDMHWTGWALQMVREAAEIDMRVKRKTERQQSAAIDSPLDFGLIQSRLSRSIRLSIAMAERIRADYLMRRGERETSGEQRRRREQAAEAVVKAAATPEDGERAEHLRATVWETLVEDEILDAQLDTLSPEAFVQAVCRKIGHPPPSIPPARGCGDIAEAASAPPAEPPADHEPAAGWPEAPDGLVTGQAAPKPLQPDSS